MKRIQVGLALCVMGGIALFGASAPAADNAGAEAGVAVLQAKAAAAVAPAATLATIAPKTSATPMDNPGTGSCPAGMVDVEGDYCTAVEQKCLRWLDPEEKMRCAEFAPTGACQGKTIHKHFCMDRFEYPNQPGEKPVIMKTWYEAKSTCEKTGKRLCGDSEWTLACEGQEHLPYPYGYARNPDACNIDKPHPDVDEKALANPQTRDAEAARLWQGEPSGFREACVSPYGIHDMTGNVDEWVSNESAKPYKSGLKGGYWGPVRTRCRPMTVAHNEEFSFYQIGFRCCSDAAASGSGTAVPASAPSGSPSGVGSPSKQNPLPGGTLTGS